MAYQYLKSAEDWMLTYSEFTSFADSNKSTEVLKNSLLEAFDLTSDFLLRGHLIKTGEATHLLAIVIHHIATDGWSMSLITKELITIYNALKVGQAPILSELKIQYADYAIWQRNHFTKSVLSEQLNYWETQLAGVTTLDLPTDYPRPPIQSTKGKSRQFLINKQLAESLETFSTKRGVTVFMTILAAFKVLLYRYSGQTDICIGSPIANRTLAEIESLVGFFVNTLALRSNLDGNPTFSTLLQQVKKTTLDAYNYQSVPFEKIVNKIGIERDRSTSPLFQVMLVLQNQSPRLDTQLEDLKLSALNFEPNNSKFDLTFNLSPTPEGLNLQIEYCSDLFHPATIDRMGQHFEILLGAIIVNPEQKIGALKMLSLREERQLLLEFNQKIKEDKHTKTSIDLFEEQVTKYPNNKALAFKERTLTYQELNEKANQLGAYLRTVSYTHLTLPTILLV